MVARVGGDGYNLLLVLHLLSVIVGFGSFFLSGYYDTEAKVRKNREGLAVAETTYKANRLAEWSIYVVPITGIVLILVSDDLWKFSQTWISLAFLVYIAFLGVLHGAYLPNRRAINATLARLVGEPAADDGGAGATALSAELDRLITRASMLGGILNVLVVIALVLMVWKPGFP